MSGECDKKCGHRHDCAMEKRRAARFILPMAALGLIAWQRAALAAVPAAAQAGQVARDEQVKRLVLGHFSARYDDESLLLDEAKTIFPDTILAHEGLIINV